MVFKKSLLLLLLTPFPNYYNGIVKKGEKHCNRTAKKKNKQKQKTS